MRSDRQERLFSTILFPLGAVVAAFGIWLFAYSPDAGQANAPRADLVAQGAKQAQTIVYMRCGHEVQRRVDVPVHFVGMNREAVAAQLDPAFRLTGFSANELEMAGSFDLFCPQHYVLMLDADGALGVYQNIYGYEMERMGDRRVGRIDEELRRKLLRGVAFDSLEELEDWVSALEDAVDEAEDSPR